MMLYGEHIEEIIKEKHSSYLPVYQKLMRTNYYYKQLQVKHFKFLSKHRSTYTVNCGANNIFHMDFEGKNTRREHWPNHVYGFGPDILDEKEKLTDISRAVADIDGCTCVAVNILLGLMNNRKDDKVFDKLRVELDTYIKKINELHRKLKIEFN